MKDFEEILMISFCDYDELILPHRVTYYDVYDSFHVFVPHVSSVIKIIQSILFREEVQLAI